MQKIHCNGLNGFQVLNCYCIGMQTLSLDIQVLLAQIMFKRLFFE